MRRSYQSEIRTGIEIRKPDQNTNKLKKVFKKISIAGSGWTVELKIANCFYLLSFILYYYVICLDSQFYSVH